MKILNHCADKDATMHGACNYTIGDTHESIYMRSLLAHSANSQFSRSATTIF